MEWITICLCKSEFLPSTSLSWVLGVSSPFSDRLTIIFHLPLSFNSSTQSSMPTPRWPILSVVFSSTLPAKTKILEQSLCSFWKILANRYLFQFSYDQFSLAFLARDGCSVSKNKDSETKLEHWLEISWYTRKPTPTKIRHYRMSLWGGKCDHASLIQIILYQVILYKLFYIKLNKSSVFTWLNFIHKFCFHILFFPDSICLLSD